MVNSDSPFLKVFVLHCVQRQSRDRRVRILRRLRDISDEVRNEFFEFSEVNSHVVLVEHEILIVLHVGGDREFE